MNFTQISMVEELASLVKDNLPCKHLILSMEESLVNFLRDDSRVVQVAIATYESQNLPLEATSLETWESSDGVLELEPMNAYNRLLLHRLAEIFGFSHQSVGEGDDRHLVFERCPETSIPPILISDLLEYDEFHPLTSSYQMLSDKASAVHDVKKVVHSSPLRRHGDGNKIQTLYDSEIKADIAIGQLSLEERKAAYLAARERIFRGSNGEMDRFSEKKPCGDPVVARRMISHALGRKLDPLNQTISHKISGRNGVQSDGVNFLQKDLNDTNLGQRCNPDVHNKKIVSSDETPDNPGVSRPHRSKIFLEKESLKQEHTGAAKRMLAHAFGFPSRTDGIQKNALK